MLFYGGGSTPGAATGWGLEPRDLENQPPEQMEDAGRALVVEAKQPIRIISNVVLRPAAAANQLELPQNQPTIPSPPSTRVQTEASRWELHAPRLSTHRHEGGDDLCFSPSHCTACYPLTRLESGYYQRHTTAPPPKTLEERQREQNARHAEYFNGTRIASLTDLEDLIDNLKGLPRAMATADAPLFDPPRRPETTEIAGQDDLSRGA